MTRCLLQGWDNFRKEAKQLRRSFRFNEYKDIRAQNPPRNFFTKVCPAASCRACPCVSLPQLAACSEGESACFMVGSPKVRGHFGRSEGSCCALQFLSSINKQIVRGLAAADLKLEEAGLLPSVEQEKLPEDITDDDGNLLNDCAEVSSPSLFF